MHSLRRSLKLLVLVVLAVATLGLGKDELRLNPAQRVAFPHTYNLLEWEAGNFLAKWVHRVDAAMPWNSISDAEKRTQVLEYFRLGEQISRLDTQMQRLVAQGGHASGGDVVLTAARIAEAESARNRIKDNVEEGLEAEISAVLAKQGLSSRLAFIFPPVDIRLGEPPKLLVTSPRDRIARTHDVLLYSDVSVERSETMEDALADTWDLSALVVDVGGVATYPASILSTLSLQATLRIASHEWLHHYLFFRPLGFNISSSSEMLTLNETFADIASREIGDQAFEAFEGVRPAPSLPDVGSTTEALLPEADGGFDFAAEMRKTRRRVDELLDDGRVEEAESYMEERRGLFVENGFSIRKLNQAFFAFSGTYAESPASISPIAGQLHEYRSLMPDLNTFITTMSKFSSYKQFLDSLEHLRSTAP